MKNKFEFLEHTADVKFRSYGSSIEEAFENAAMAMKKVILEDVEIEEKMEKKIEIEGKDKEQLLRNFLQELLYLLEGKNFMFSKFEKMEIKDDKDYILYVTLLGDSNSNYDIINPVKAVTYNEMFVKEEDNKFICQVILDV